MRKNVIFLLAVQCSNYLFPMLTLPYLLRVLGASEYGVYVLILAYTQYAILLVDYGFGFTVTRQISQARNSPGDISQIFSITIAAKLLLVCVSVIFAALTLFQLHASKTIWIYGGIASLAVLGNAIYPIWLYQGIERMGPISVTTVGARAIITVSTFLFVRSPQDTSVALFINSFTFLLPGVILVVYSLRRTVMRIYIPTWSDILNSYRLAFPLFISSIATSFYTTFNTIILGAYFPASSVGSYGAADKVRVAVQGVFLPFTQAIFPKICAYTDNKEFLENFKKYGLPFSLFSISIALGIALFGRNLAAVYFGSGNLLAASYFEKMAAIPAIVGLAVVFGQWYMVARGYSKNIGAIYVIGSCAHLLYAIPAIKHWGVSGVIYSVILTEFMLTAAMIVFFFKKEVWGRRAAKAF